MTQIAELSAVPTPGDAELATVASRSLSRAPSAELRIQIDGGEVLRLPKAVNGLLYRLLAEMAQGNSVTLIPADAELTTQQAADYLNVSRPYLIGLLKQGALAHRMVGTHRRVKFSDLRAYSAMFEERRSRAMQALADQAQELDMGY